MIIVGYYLCCIMVGMNTGAAIYWQAPYNIGMSSLFLFLAVMFRVWEHEGVIK